MNGLLSHTGDSKRGRKVAAQSRTGRLLGRPTRMDGGFANWLSRGTAGGDAGEGQPASDGQMLKMNGHTLSKKLADSYLRLTMLLILKHTQKHAHQYVPVLHAAS